ncbi:MAG: hypothetical protein EOP79_08235 [Variovorax sp.]|nr:MAG: hypothetical protein EOP79_08235 [Variovorax sp.]
MTSRTIAMRPAPRRRSNFTSVSGKYAFPIADTKQAFMAPCARDLSGSRSAGDSDNLDVRNPSFTLFDIAIGFDCGPGCVSLNINNPFEAVLDGVRLQHLLTQRKARRQPECTVSLLNPLPLRTASDARGVASWRAEQEYHGICPVSTRL